MIKSSTLQKQYFYFFTPWRPWDWMMQPCWISLYHDAKVNPLWPVSVHTPPLCWILALNPSMCCCKLLSNPRLWWILMSYSVECESWTIHVCAEYQYWILLRLLKALPIGALSVVYEVNTKKEDSTLRQCCPKNKPWLQIQVARYSQRTRNVKCVRNHLSRHWSTLLPKVSCEGAEPGVTERPTSKSGNWKPHHH